MAKHKKRLLEERQKEIEDLVNKANKNSANKKMSTIFLCI